MVPDGPAWTAGITYGDEVIAVAGQRVNAATVARRFADHAPGKTVEVHLFRKDGLRVVRVVLGENPERRLQLAPAARPLRSGRAIRRGWLGV